MVALGEIGLSGELRSVSHLEQRLAEAEKLGFRSALIPRTSLRRGKPRTRLQLIAADSLREAMDAATG